MYPSYQLLTLREKVARLLSAKTTLAARVDSLHESSDGAIGRGFFDQIKQKIEKMLEPPPIKAAKPLPKPLDKVSYLLVFLLVINYY